MILAMRPLNPAVASSHHLHRSKAWGVALATCVAACATAFSAFAAPARAADAQPTAVVRVAALQRGGLAQRASALGTMRVGNAQGLSLTFPRPVEVLRVLVRQGDAVRRGQRVLVVRGVPGSDLAWVQARDAVRFARAGVQRAEQLASRQLATRADVDAAHKALADAQALLAAADAQQLGAGATTRTAPLAGVVTAVQVAPGAVLAAGAPALILAPGGRDEAVVGVPLDVAAALRPGQKANVRAVFDGDQQAAAAVASVSRVVDPTTHLVDVVLVLAAPVADWIPGTSIEAAFDVDSWTGWVVPRQAVLTDAAGQAYVFQDDHGRAHRVDVALKIDTATRSGIAGPLRADLPVVVLGNYELIDGMPLKVRR